MPDRYAFPDTVVFVNGDLELHYTGDRDPRSLITIGDVSFLDVVVSIDPKMFSRSYAAAWHRRDFKGMLDALKATNWERLVEILTELQRLQYRFTGWGEVKAYEDLLGYVKKGFVIA